MSNTYIKKVSEITVSDLADFLRLSEIDASEINQLSTFLTVAKSYCESYTGIPITAEEGETLDDYPDVVIAVLILVQDMYDNRSMYVDKNARVNKTVESILNMHLRNLL